jgi:V/A-type H+-transporting ATPase subunit F
MEFFFIGDPELVTAFRFIGIEGTTVRDSAEATAVFRRITEGWNETAGAALPQTPDEAGSRVLIMTEETADWLGDVLIEWQLSGSYPLVVEIPGIMGRVPGRKTLVDSIREAIGVHV